MIEKVERGGSKISESKQKEIILAELCFIALVGKSDFLQEAFEPRF
jgi:hypothetical protein